MSIKKVVFLVSFSNTKGLVWYPSSIKKVSKILKSSILEHATEERR